MIQKMNVGEDGVLAFRVEGKLECDAFLKCAFEVGEKLDRNERFSIYLQVAEQEGVDFRVVWNSIRFAMAYFRQYLRQVDKIAIVTDSKWIHRITEFENYIFAGVKEKAFTAADEEAALRWIGLMQKAIAA